MFAMISAFAGSVSLTSSVNRSGHCKFHRSRSYYPTDFALYQNHQLNVNCKWLIQKLSCLFLLCAKSTEDFRTARHSAFLRIDAPRPLRMIQGEQILEIILKCDLFARKRNPIRT